MINKRNSNFYKYNLNPILTLNKVWNVVADFGN
jgi:hypothetical protein